VKHIFNMVELSTAELIERARRHDPVAELELRERARAGRDVELLREAGALVDLSRRGVERFVDSEGVEHTIPAPWRR
jgi:hypothetical protein